MYGIVLLATLKSLLHTESLDRETGQEPAWNANPIDLKAVSLVKDEMCAR